MIRRYFSQAGGGVDFNEEKDVREGGTELDAVVEDEQARAEASGGTSATPTELAGGAAGGGNAETAGLGVDGGSAPAGDAPGDAQSPASS